MLLQGTVSTLTEMSERLKSLEGQFPLVESKLDAKLEIVEASVASLIASVESNFKVVIEKLCGSKPNSEEELNSVPLFRDNVTCIGQSGKCGPIYFVKLVLN